MMGMGMGVGFSSPPPWTPAALGAGIWLRAKNVLTTGALVDQVTDLSGNGIHATSAGVLRPSLIAAATPTGGPVIRGTGTQRLVIGANVLGVANTIAMVVTPTTDTNDYWLDSNPTGRANILSGFGGVSFEWLGNFVDRLTFAAAVAGLHTIIMRQTDGGALNLYFDSATPVATKAVAANPLAGASLSKIFCNLTDTTANFVKGDFAEMIQVPRAVSDGEIASLVAYLRAEHGTP